MFEVSLCLLILKLNNFEMSVFVIFVVTYIQRLVKTTLNTVKTLIKRNKINNGFKKRSRKFTKR